MSASEKQKKKKGSTSILRKLFGVFGVLTAVVLIAAVLAGCSMALSAPSVTDLAWSSSTVIYDRTGQEVYRLHAGENRTPVKLQKIPKHVYEAFIAIEDPGFAQHNGLDYKGIARAGWRTGLHLLGLPGGRLEGGSTITQQLARDGWLTQDVTVKRKVQEMWVALQLERSYTKDEILEMYLNQIYFGHGAYGVEAAARTFFAKDVGQLTIAEGAQLAGMINGPSIFDPYIDMKASLTRRDLVLDAMAKVNFIDQQTYQQAKAEQPELGSKELERDNKAGSFTDYVINVLQDAKPGLAAKYGINLGDVGSVAKAGLKVYTTVDPQMQALAEQAVVEQMAQADEQYGTGNKEERPEAAMVVMHPKTGEVLAMVGGRDHQAMLEFNRAADALRQPGSATKPILAYLPALEAGLSPATVLDDAALMLTGDGKDLWPKDYEDRYSGLQPMRKGVEQSMNPIAVRAMQAGGGPEKGLEFANKFGMTTIGAEDNHLALALGGVTNGVTVLDVTAAYSAVANMGLKVDPVVITRIEDRDGNKIFEARPRKQQVVRPSSAYMMVDMMKDVIRKGTAHAFTNGFNGWPAAGKTGTTEYNQDSWFVGFTPDLVATVWNGYDNQANLLPWTGAFVPVKTWNQFMSQAVTEKPNDWARPSDVANVSVCRQTGMLPNELCARDQVLSELFLTGTEPRSAGDMLVKAKAVQVNTEWQLWRTGCPGRPVDRVFIKRPQPRVLHPTDPFNPRYVPADAKDELPTVTCEPAAPVPRQNGRSILPPGGNWRDLLPQLPWMQRPGNQQPGDQQQGDEKSGDEKSGDEKSGDEKSGDEKSGDGKSGDGKSGDEKRGDERSGNPGGQAQSSGQNDDDDAAARGTPPTGQSPPPTGDASDDESAGPLFGLVPKLP